MDSQNRLKMDSKWTLKTQHNTISVWVDTFTGCCSHLNVAIDGMVNVAIDGMVLFKMGIVKSALQKGHINQAGGEGQK